MSRKKLNRDPLESMLWSYLEGSRHRLEAFTDRDYFLTGADEIWSIAGRKINNMPNYELIGICKNITDCLTYKRNFDTYYEVFNYELAGGN